MKDLENWGDLDKRNVFSNKQFFISELQFRWKYRRRLRLTLTGQQKKIYAPAMELYSQQLLYPEYRYLDTQDHELLRLVS